MNSHDKLPQLFKTKHRAMPLNSTLNAVQLKAAEHHVFCFVSWMMYLMYLVQIIIFIIIFASGQNFHNQHQNNIEVGFKSTGQSYYTLDHVIELNRIINAIETMNTKLKRLKELWQRRDAEMAARVQLSDLEKDMKTVCCEILFAESSGFSYMSRFFSPAVIMTAEEHAVLGRLGAKKFLIDSLAPLQLFPTPNSNHAWKCFFLLRLS